jgi:CheY-like chemotaxis protein
MVLLYDATATHNVRWARSVPAGLEVILASDIATFDDVSARANGVVAFVRDDEDAAFIKCLRTLRTMYPLKFLIVVRPSLDCPALPVSVDAVVSVTLPEPMLWATVRDVEACGLFHRLADVIRSAETFPPLLRLALVHALLRPTPVSSIKELAAEIGCERRTLPRSWEIHFNAKSDRLIDFLDWIMLLYAIGRKTPKRSWTVVSRDIGVTEETLSRSARQLLGRTLTELSIEGQPCVLARFRLVFERLFGRWPDEAGANTRLPRPVCQVLVVDDHEAIRQFLDRSLRKAGFDIATTAAGDEALLHIARAHEPPAIVLTDIKMPGMNGIELARRIAEHWPSVQIVLMSAFISVDGIKLDWWREDISQSLRFLSKPFTAGRAIAVLREACESSESTQPGGPDPPGTTRLD